MLAQCVPVEGERVHVSRSLAEPFPDLFGRVEPGGIGGQPQDLDRGIVGDALPGAGMEVNGPVVHDKEDFLALRTGCG